MSDVAGALDRIRLAVGETDAMAAIAVAWFDGVDQSGADPVLVERIGYLLEVIARSAATAASKVDSVHAAIADAQPVRPGEAFDYSHGTSPGEGMSAEDAAIVRRIRTRCPDRRFDGGSDAELLDLFKRNKQVMRMRPVCPTYAHALRPMRFTRADKTKSVNRLLRKIESLGFEVTGIREKQAA